MLSLGIEESLKQDEAIERVLSLLLMEINRIFRKDLANVAFHDAMDC